MVSKGNAVKKRGQAKEASSSPIAKRHTIQVPDNVYKTLDYISRHSKLPKIAIISYLITSRDKKEIVRELVEGGVQPARVGRPKQTFHR